MELVIRIVVDGEVLELDEEEEVDEVIYNIYLFIMC